MGAAASIFGALAGLGETGNQLAEARQYNAEQAVKRLALQQQSQAFKTSQEESRQRMADAKTRNQREQQLITQGNQAGMIGTPFIHGGKSYARFQDPNTGALSVKELPGGNPETAEETMHRGLVAIGIPEQDASQAVIAKFRGKPTEKREITPDPQSATGYSAVYYDTGGNEVWRAETTPPRFLTPTETKGSSVDPFGNVTTHTSIRRPLLNLGNGLSPSGATPSPRVAVPGAPATRPGASPALGGQPAAHAPSATTGDEKETPLNIGTYKGLAPNGEIPARPGMNPQVVAFANDILAGRDVQKIPTKARALAESMARAYGWKGQGSLTPAQQMQIEQVDNSLAALSDPRYLKLFDSTLGKLKMSMIPLDPTGEGGFAGLKAALGRGSISKDQAEYMDTLTRLRGVIGGIRGFTGANNSNATADRLLAELPNFTNTKDSADAKFKLEKLRQEVSIIKRLGYFLPAAPGAAPAGALPPAGAVVRDFTQVGP